MFSVISFPLALKFGTKMRKCLVGKDDPALRARYVVSFNYTWINAIYIYTVTITLLPFSTQLSKYAMTVAHEASAARESIGIAEKRQQYFDICE